MSFFGRLLGRKPKPLFPDGDGSLDGCWRSGDLAVAISDIWTNIDGYPVFNAPTRGDVVLVTYVDIVRGYHCLTFAEYPDAWWTARSFRKAVTGEQEACEPEFVTLLKRTKRTVRA